MHLNYFLSKNISNESIQLNSPLHVVSFDILNTVIWYLDVTAIGRLGSTCRFMNQVMQVQMKFFMIFRTTPYGTISLHVISKMQRIKQITPLVIGRVIPDF